MTMETKHNIFREHLSEWLKATGNKKRRGEIIKHICFVASVHPKSVPRSFRRVQLRDPTQRERRGRKLYYTADVIAALKNVWEIASEPCGENLHAIIPDYVHILKRDRVWPASDETTVKLLKMSLGTVKKRVARFSRQQFWLRGQSTTQRSAIHALIPVRTGPWNEAPVGTEQIDTVAHCGGSVAGDFVYTVNATDVPTLWGSRRAQWNKGQEATVRSMEYMSADTPFPVVEWHPDSGSEFINWHCQGWCEAHGEKLTRSRPNHKNDNCFVEERNGHVIRRWVGYTRLDASATVDSLNAVYDLLTPYLNHFVASKRTVSKDRLGARWQIRREQQAQTPYQRLLQRHDVSAEVKAKLTREHDDLNPLRLKREIDRRLAKVFDIQKRHRQPKLGEAFR
jgi:hypothetical protein